MTIGHRGYGKTMAMFSVALAIVGVLLSCQPRLAVAQSVGPSSIYGIQCTRCGFVYGSYHNCPYDKPAPKRKPSRSRTSSSTRVTRPVETQAQRERRWGIEANQKGVDASHQGDFKTALHHYRIAANYLPGDFNVLLNILKALNALGNEAHRAEKYDVAVAYYEETVSRGEGMILTFPNRPEIHRYVALAYRMLGIIASDVRGDMQRGERLLRKGLRHDPADSNAKEWLGWAERRIEEEKQDEEEKQRKEIYEKLRKQFEQREAERKIAEHRAAERIRKQQEEQARQFREKQQKQRSAAMAANIEDLYNTLARRKRVSGDLGKLVWPPLEVEMMENVEPLPGESKFTIEDWFAPELDHEEVLAELISASPASPKWWEDFKRHNRVAFKLGGEHLYNWIYFNTPPPPSVEIWRGAVTVKQLEAMRKEKLLRTEVVERLGEQIDEARVAADLKGLEKQYIEQAKDREAVVKLYLEQVKVRAAVRLAASKQEAHDQFSKQWAAEMARLRKKHDVFFVFPSSLMETPEFRRELEEIHARLRAPYDKRVGEAEEFADNWIDSNSKLLKLQAEKTKAIREAVIKNAHAHSEAWRKANAEGQRDWFSVYKEFADNDLLENVQAPLDEQFKNDPNARSLVLDHLIPIRVRVLKKVKQIEEEFQKQLDEAIRQIIYREEGDR